MAHLYLDTLNATSLQERQLCSQQETMKTKGAHIQRLCAYLCSDVRQKPSAALFMEFSKCIASNNVLYIALTFPEALKLALWHKTAL